MGVRLSLAAPMVIVFLGRPGQFQHVLLTSPGIDRMNCLLATFQAISNEGKQHMIDVLRNVEERVI